MAYILFSASSSFYIPMIIVCCVYVKIYLAASAATKSAYSGMMQVSRVSVSHSLYCYTQYPTVNLGNVNSNLEQNTQRCPDAESFSPVEG
jgi:hypothetical protein